jgi:peptidyl-prolyl cis-trans isomerase D
MLKFFRKASQGYAFKTLFLLIIISFAGWGLSGIFAGNMNSQAVAKIGKQSITQQNLYTTFQRNLQQLRQRSGSDISAEQAVYSGLMGQSLDQLILNSLLSQASEDANIAINDDVAIQQIKSMKAFTDLRGQFNAELFQQVLSQNRISEDEFVASIKNDMSIQLLMSSLLNSIYPTKDQLKLAFWIEHEQRDVEVLFLPQSSLEAPKDPGDDVLKTFIQSRATQYQSADLRDMTYLKITLKDIYNQIEVNDSKLKDIYNQNIENYNIPEQRDISQLVFDTKDKADEFIKLMHTKQLSFVDTAKEMKVEPNHLKHLSKSEIMFESLSNWVFASKSGEVSPPLKSSIGWIVAKINHISPAHIKIYEMVKADLKDEYLEKASHRKIEDLADMIDEKISEGQSFEDIAHAFKLSLFNIKNMDASGQLHNADRTSQSDIPVILINEAFQLDVGEESSLLEDENGNFYLLRLNAETPSRFYNLSEIRPRVLKDWQNVETKMRLSEKSYKIVQDLTGGISFKENATKNKGKYINLPPVKRSDLEKNRKIIPDQLFIQIFEHNQGDIFTIEAPTGVYIAKLNSIKMPEKASDEALSKYDARMKELLKADIMQLYRQNLAEDIGIKTNDKSIEQITKYVIER